jgi:hypothetical protein
MNTLCWSLTKSKSDTTDFGEFVYDMYYLSIVMAKNLGYRTILYGNSNAILRLREICDEVINIDRLDYQLYDDPKVYIWENRQGDYTTIDGDVFLYKRLNFREDYLHKKFDIRVEKFQPLNRNKLVYDAWNMFNSFNPSSIIPFWNGYPLADSYNTGIVYWDNQQVKQFYIQNYYILREWYIRNKILFDSSSSYMMNDISIPSHFICEHLMRRVVHYFDLNVESLFKNGNNSYTHLVGADKFRNPDHYIGIGLLVKHIKDIRRQGYTNHKLDIERIYKEISKLYGAV